MTEIILYKTEDGNEFYNKMHAQEYEDEMLHLKYIENTYLGDKLKYPGIGEGPCLETRQHTQSQLKQVFMECLVILNNHDIQYSEKYDDEQFNRILSSMRELQNAKENDNIQVIWDRLIWCLKRLAYCYYFPNERHFNNRGECNLIHQIIRRLSNSSYITGVEYPDDATYSWKNRENEWQDYVEREKKYQAEGGGYR